MRKLLMIVSTLLLFVCAICLYWNIDPGVEIMFGVYILFNAGIVFLLGGVVCALFWFSRSPGTARGCWQQLLSFGVFCILPPVGGLFASFWIEDTLMRYYRSDAFEQSYASNQGIVRIQPLERKAVFAHCQLIGYETTYELEVTQSQTLIFAREDLDNWPYTFFDLSFASSDVSPIPLLGHTFAKIDDVYVRWGFSQELGLYEVPAGKHVFRLPADKPSTLTLFDDHALWTPSGMLAGDVRYPRVYHELLSSEEYNEAVRDAREQSCQGTHIQEGKTYFLNQHVLLPGYKTDQFEERDAQLFFPDGRGGESTSAHSSGTYSNNQTIPIPAQAVLYKQVVNTYTQQTLNIYFIAGTKPKPTKNIPNQEVGPCIHSRGFDEEKFLRELPGKTSFDHPERLHINCSGSYFFVDQPLKMAGTVVHFDDRYDTANIDRVVDVMQVVEPAVIHEISIPVSGSNP